MILEFGQLEQETTATEQLTVSNTGDTELQVTETRLDGLSGVFSIDLAPMTFTVAAGESRTIGVTYTPEAGGGEHGEVIFFHNDEDRPNIYVALHGGGMVPGIELSESAVEFTDVGVGCEASAEIVIRNVGPTTLILENVVISSTSDEFIVDDVGLDGAVLHTGDELTALVVYAPQDEVPDSAEFLVYSNDPAMPLAASEVTGSAVLTPATEDEFLQGSTVPEADILWVVDNTCSMTDYTADYAADAAVFIEELDARGVDYHIAVIPTDGPDFTGPVPIITPATPDPAAVFTSAISLGTDGGTPLGLKYGTEALSSPYTDPGGPHDGFLRDEAFLHVIFFSASLDNSPVQVTDYVNIFWGLKADADDVGLSCIVEPASGQRYEQAATLAGGFESDITTVNIPFVLEYLAHWSHHPPRFFELSQLPLEETIEVQLNQVPITEGWDYDDFENAVRFDLDQIPDEGDTITILYNPAVCS